MKKIVLILLMPLLAACSVQQPVAINTSQYNEHPAPYKVHAIGQWGKEYYLLTLTDIHDNYFTVVTPKQDSLTEGDVWQPQQDKKANNRLNIVASNGNK
jgi:hypothetical protein